MSGSETSGNQSRDLFERALEAGRNRDYPGAIALLKQVLLQTDQIPEALLYLGRAYHALSDFNRAVQVLHFFVRVHPDSAPGRFFLGRAYFCLGLPQPAVSELRQACVLDDQFVPALGLLGLALLRSGRPRAAVAAFERALKLEPGNQKLFTGYLNALLTQGVRSYYRGSYQEAREQLSLIARHRPDSLVAHLYLSSIYRELGETRQALHHLEEASRLAPMDPVLYMQKAVLHLQAGEHPAAYDQLRKGMKLLGGQAVDVQDAQQLLRLMTIVLFQNRRHREALECARRVLRHDYADADMHAIMAECFSSLGELGKARNHYLRALESCRDKPEFSYGLADVLWRQSEYQQLNTLLERLLKLNPGDEFAAYYRALCLPFLTAPSEETIPALQEQIRHRGPDPHLMYALGREYLRADLPKLAEGWFRRTLRRVENDEPSLRGLIQVYLATGDSEALAGAYAGYLAHCPGDLALRRDYADLLVKQKRYGPASAEIERILPHDPGNAQLRRMLAYAYRKSAKYTEAILLYRELLLESPRSRELLDPLLACLEQSGSRRAAMLILEKAVKLFKNDASLLQHLGELYLREQELERASAAFREIISLHPQQWQAHLSLAKIYRQQGNTAFAERFAQRAEQLRKKARTTATGGENPHSSSQRRRR
jgi:tetratricopeptide (TPR) repeat protein